MIIFKLIPTELWCGLGFARPRFSKPWTTALPQIRFQNMRDTAPLAAQEASSAHYLLSQPSRDGTGKFYMGREIAQVMGHRGASWLQRPEREKKERTDLLISLLGPVSYTHLTLPTIYSV